MKHTINSFLVISCFLFLSASYKISDDPDKKQNNPQHSPSYYTIDSKQMNGNNISTWFRNNGSFNRDPATGSGGFTWSTFSIYEALRYASGLWIAAKVGDDTLVAIAEYDYEYLPGYIDINGNPQGKNDPEFRVYRINKNEFESEDYLNWPVNQGAYLDSTGKPFLPGNQTMFLSYTDGYPESHGNNAGSTAPLKTQVQVTNWCYKYNPVHVLSNTIFTEMKIINKNNLAWEEAFVTIWSDETNSASVSIGCDTILTMGYSYYQPNSTLGPQPPALAFTVLKGVEVYTGNISDTVFSFSPASFNKKIIKVGYKEIKFSSFHSITNADPINGDPANYRETYLVMHGFRKSGANWYLPGTNTITYFPYSGDPETGSGWIQSDFGNKRFMMNIGPLNVNPGDTQSIIFAQVIDRGLNNLNSVTKLKKAVNSVRNCYNNNFDLSIDSPKPAVSSYAPGTGRIYLSWNDSCERTSMKNKLSGGTYRFQGYNIYRIKPNNFNPSSADTFRIKTFDIKDGIKDIRDSIYLNEYEGITYGIVQRGSDNGISRYIALDKDTVSGITFTNGSEYKFAVTAYYFDSSGGIYTLPKVYESPRHSNIVKVIPQNLTSGVHVSYAYGDTIRTDQKDLAVMPVIIEPMQLINATYTSIIGMHDSALAWTLSKTINGKTSIIFQNEKNFSGQDTAKVYDGMMLIHQIIRDSGIVRDPNPSITTYQSIKYPSNKNGWEYDPPENLWFEGPDTQAVKTAKVITNRQFQSRSTGMSFPTIGTFKNAKSKILATGKYFQHVASSNPILTGGPLRKIRIEFGISSMSYRFVPDDSTYTSAGCSGMVSIPFRVFAVDELDSSLGSPRQLNTAFMDTDNDGSWDPDASLMGNYQFTYIFASNYDSVPNAVYLSKNIGNNSPSNGFPSMDVMYVWLPRAKKKPDSTPMTFMPGDKLTVWPYRITREEFVPGYNIKYSWTVTGTQTGSSELASAEINKIKAFPNPYYGMSELEYDSGGEKFIYFSHLPAVCDIYIYTLNGSLVRKIQRNTGDPESSLEKWDLMNSDNQRVASGMYIVYIDCKGAGIKTLKIAVFTTI
ncbi:MAG: hypothetical protein HGGPFJEG_03032 [Ignavibacteria bacterium]|nr:hypothetical protein [Ignavibacteria bacterium]